MDAETAQCDIMELFVHNLTTALDAAGMKWSRLSELSHIHHGNLSRIRTGREKLTLDRAETICRAIGYHLHEMTNPNFKPHNSKKNKQPGVAA